MFIKLVQTLKLVEKKVRMPELFYKKLATF